MPTRTTTSFTFPVVSFRHLETPFVKRGFKNHFAVLDIRDLPDLSHWRDINVRDPKLKGTVPRAIRCSVHDNPELFLFMNRGIVLSVASTEFNTRKSEITVTLEDPSVHGLLDGGHTYNILLEESHNLEEPQFVKIEFLQGFKADEIPPLVEARNTSNQVRDQSLMNLRKQFEDLKAALNKQQYADLIAYAEHEILDDGGAKPIDVRDVIAMLTVFDRDHFTEQVHPIIAYRSKAACLKHFADHPDSFAKLLPLTPEILQLYDYIQLYLPDLYSEARKRRGDVKEGRFGGLTGVTKYDGRRRAKQLLFINQGSQYGVPAGFVYPMLGAFRALLEPKDERYMWGKGINPVKLLKGNLGIELAGVIGDFALDIRNPSKTGKSQIVWQSCYKTGQVAYLEA